MIVDALFLALFLGVAAFVWWRLWVSVTTRRVDVRGWIFERSEQPERYWIHVGLNIAAAVMLSALAAVMVMGASNSL
jgi:hypothetical protein